MPASSTCPSCSRIPDSRSRSSILYDVPCSSSERPAASRRARRCGSLRLSVAKRRCEAAKGASGIHKRTTAAPPLGSILLTGMYLSSVWKPVLPQPETRPPHAPAAGGARKLPNASLGSHTRSVDVRSSDAAIAVVGAASAICRPQTDVWCTRMAFCAQSGPRGAQRWCVSGMWSTRGGLCACGGLRTEVGDEARVEHVPHVRVLEAVDDESAKTTHPAVVEHALEDDRPVALEGVEFGSGERPHRVCRTAAEFGFRHAARRSRPCEKQRADALLSRVGRGEHGDEQREDRRERDRLLCSTHLLLCAAAALQDSVQRRPPAETRRRSHEVRCDLMCMRSLTSTQLPTGGMLSAAALASVSESLEAAILAALSLPVEVLTALSLPVEVRSSEALPDVAKYVLADHVYFARIFVAKYILAQLDGEALPTSNVPASEGTSSADTSAKVAELSKWFKALNAAVRTNIEPLRAVAYYLMMDDIFHLGLTTEQGGRLLQMYEDGVIDRLEAARPDIFLPPPEGLNPSMSDPAVRARALLNGDNRDKNARGEYKMPPLIDAVIRGDVEAVQSLLKAGADANTYDGLEELSALHHTIHCPYIGNGEHRQSAYYDMDYPDPKRAAEIVKLLLDAKADAMALIQSRSTPPLEWAAHNGKCDCVRLLLDGGAEIDCMVRGASALGAACGGQHADIVKLLIERRADVNRRVADPGFSPVEPLHDASGRGYVDIVQLLVEAGADLMDLDICDRTALDCAIANNELECAKILSGAMAAAEQRSDE